MTTTPGVSLRTRWAWWRGRASGRCAGLTGYRYLLAVAVLVALTTVPMLVAAMAGAAALSQPAPPVGDTTPFVTYSRPAAAPGYPSWPHQPH